MSDGKAAEFPFRTEEAPHPYVTGERVRVVVGPGYPKIGLYMHEGELAPHMNRAWHSRDAEVDALKEEVVAYKKTLGDSQTNVAYLNDFNHALRKENERIRGLLKQALKDMTVNDSDCGCDCHDGDSCDWEKHLELVAAIEFAIAQLQDQEVNP